MKKDIRKERIAVFQSPIMIGEMKLRWAEPTIDRMEKLGALLNFDLWLGDPRKDPLTHKRLMCRFDGNAEACQELIALCCQELPEGFDVDLVTGLELGAVLQGFFIYYHLRAGTIQLSESLSPPPKASKPSRSGTKPKSRKSTAESEPPASEC